MNNPRTHAPDDDGWVTFSRARIGGRPVLIQKKDGSTRTVWADRPECPWMGTNGHSYPGDEKRTVGA